MGRRVAARSDPVKQSGGWTIRLLGVAITVKPAFFLIILLLARPAEQDAGGVLTWVVVVTISILWHELGHVAAFRAFGVDSRIELWAFGGLTFPTSWTPEKRPLADVVVGLAGPVAGLLLGAAVYAVAGESDPGASLVQARIVSDVLWVNVGWSLLNLLPVAPLDGGRVFASALRALFRGREGEAATIVSLVTVAVGICVAVVRRDIWVAVLAAWLGHYNAQRLRRARTRPGQRRPEDEPRPPDWVAKSLEAFSRGDLQTVVRLSRRQLDPLQQSPERSRAALFLTWAQLMEDCVEDAAAVADAYLSKAIVSPVLYPGIDEAAGGAKSATSILRRAHDVHPSRAMAMLLVGALIESGRPDEATRLFLDPQARLGDLQAGRGVHLLLVQNGHWGAAVEVGRRLLGKHPDALVAFNTACGCARLGLRTEAVSWLNAAIDAGFDDATQLEKDLDLDSLRGHAGYELARDRLSSAAGMADG